MLLAQTGTVVDACPGHLRSTSALSVHTASSTASPTLPSAAAALGGSAGGVGGCLPLSTHAGLSNHPGSLPGPLVMCELVALGDEVHFRSSHEMFRKLLSCAGEW